MTTTLQLFTGSSTRRLPLHLTLEQTFDRLSPQLKRLEYLSIQPFSETSWVDRFLQLVTPHLHSLEILQVLSLTELEIVSFYMKNHPSNRLHFIEARNT